MVTAMILLSALLLAGLVGVALVARYQERFFLLALGLLMLGYLLLGKGIAYLGIAPLYISEITLAISCGTLLVLTLIRGRIYIGAIRHWVFLYLLLFMVWGGLITLTDLPRHRMDALRDAVIWGYAVFALCVALLVAPQELKRMLDIYGRLLPYILVAMLVAWYMARFTPLPSLPGSPGKIIWVKAGDAGVHLGGAGAFLLLRLDRVYGKAYPKWMLWLMWIFWGVLWIVYSGASRSSMISAVLALVVCLALRPNLSGWLRPAVLIGILVVGLLINEATGVLQERFGMSRQVTLTQLTTNVTSLVGGRAIGDQEATLNWRLMWWGRIVDYTFGGDYLWTGKGFGVNLMMDDGIGGTARPGQELNRHPHNITMNVLARMGLPGLILWLLFLVSHGARLLAATTRPGFAGRTSIWLLAYWMSFLFNAHTDVFLEGPMGGVWFWALVGFSWVYIYRVPKWRPSAQAAAAPVAASVALPAPGLAQFPPQQPI